MSMFVAADGRSRNLQRLGVKIRDETETSRKVGGKNCVIN